MRAMTKQKERETCILQCKTVMNVLQVVMQGTLTTNMEVHRAVITDAVVNGGMMSTFALSTLGVLSITGIVRYQEVIRTFLQILFYKSATIKLEERETVILEFKSGQNVTQVLMQGLLTPSTVGGRAVRTMAVVIGG